MKYIKYAVIILILFLGLIQINLFSAETAPGDFTLGTTSYISYETEIKQGDGLQGGAFKINRSYLTLKKSIYKNLGFRITLDAWQDDTGDMKARLKYIYAHYLFDDISFITKPNIEFGQVHTPWLDFEEHLNYYRMQGTMFMERSGLFNSSDFGITVASFLGGEMDAEYKENVNSKYAGRYGSFAVGVYNGGGYHAKELTQNKVFEGRLTIRPLTDIVPGLQFSYFGVIGKGNMDYAKDSIPDWNLNSLMLSYEQQYFTFTGTWIDGIGNQKGNFILDDNDSLTLNYKPSSVQGFSGFLEIKPDEHWRGILRYDKINNDAKLSPDDSKKYSTHSRFIIGVAYDLGNENILILDFDKMVFEDKSKPDKNLLKLTMQVNF